MLNASSAARAQSVLWTRPFLVELSDVVRQALESWAGEAVPDAPDLDRARSSARQLAATLQTLGIHGAATLAAELSEALEAIEQPDAETATVLLESIAVLPDYLERLETGAPDTPAVLVPFVDRMRAAVGLPARVTTSGVAALDVLRIEPSHELEPEALRRAYQRALRDWLRDPLEISELREFATRLKTSELRPVARLGVLTEAVFAGLAGRNIRPGPGLQAHLAALDKLLHDWQQSGRIAADDTAVEKVAEGLLKDLQAAEPGTPEIDQVRALLDGNEVVDAAELERARSVLSGRNRELFTALAEAARGELNRAKDALNEFLLGRSSEQPDIATQAGTLQSVAESFAMLGLGRLREKVRAQADRLGDLTADPDNPVLLDVARELLLVESELDEAVLFLGEAPESDLLEGAGDHLPKAEYRRVMRQLLRESLEDIGQAKHLLDQAHRGQAESGTVERAMEILARVAGVLRMAGHAQPAEMIEASVRCIGEEMTGGAGDPTRLEALAEALVVVEFYLDSLTRLDNRGVEYLENSRRRLVEMGYLEVAAELATQQAADDTTAADEVEVEDPQDAGDGLSIVPLDSDRELEAADGLDASVESIAATEPERTQAAGDELEILPLDDTAETGTEDLTEQPESETEAFEAGQPESPPSTETGEDRTEADLESEVFVPGGSALDDDDFDLMSIFLEEFDEELATLQDRFPRWRAEPTDSVMLTDIRRSFHTLKGSGRMAGAVRIGEFAWDVEQMLNQTIDGQYSPDQVVELVGEAIAALPSLRAAQVGQTPELDPAAIDAITQRVRSVGAVTELPELEGLDETLIQLMIREIGDHLETIDQWIEDSHARGWAADVRSDLIRAVHTIKGTLRLAPIGNEAESMQLVEEYLQELLDTDAHPADAAIELMTQLRAMLGKRMARLNREAVSSEHFATDGLAAQARSLLSGLHQLADRRPEAIAPTEDESELEDQIETEAELEPEAQTEAELENEVEAEAVTGPEELEDEIEVEAEDEAEVEAEAEAELEDEAEVEAEAEAELEDEAEVEAEAEAELEDEAEVEAEAGLEDEAELEAEAEAEPDRTVAFETEHQPGPAPIVAEVPEQEPTIAVDYAALDPELLELFTDEAQELLEHADGLLQQWREQPDDRQLVTALQRDIHTIKGSARMAGLNPVGEVAHVLEDLLENIAGGRQQVTLASIDTMESGCDHLHAMLEAVAKQEALPARAAGAALDEEQQALETQIDASAIDTRDVDEARLGRTTTLRIASGTVEELLNFAGEVSIFRSRIEQEIGSFRSNIGEVEQTVARLREQLRKLEQETEAQILSRYEREHGAHDSTFDPLELDRYSTIQQLSRALAESVSDLNSLTELMDDAGRQSETLLMQQARVNTELQEGLMQARMVSFNTLAPRLRRVVRNAARDAGRKAELQIRLAGEGELDRNVLDRVTAPIEHLLRNAIAHGIESPADRRAAGKSDTGTITIEIDREATELLIRLSDDGAGLNYEKIAARALAMDLLTAEQAEDQEQLAQVIFRTGFSTAAEVSELAGRGVGMDVVSSEIRQIGGRILVDSKSGQGTSFTLRIPLSLAVMQAIFVTAGERLFSIPLQAVKGVARIRPAEWREALDSDASFRYGGEDYPLMELEPQLGFDPVEVGESSLSLLMVSTGTQKAAMRVTDIVGHREIVLKPVGPHISSIPGILGGTIMGDGQVVVILDVAPMIERALQRQILPGQIQTAGPAVVEEEIKRTPLVMVVDDSITMRRVTARILENQGLEVITARDGVDAVELLYERVPDVMLLDIEMPRMDGFELAAHVRGDSRLAHVPLMMITSRSGDKHREHARELGVDRYLIKPYQEANMVRNVFEMLELPVPGQQE